jgi:hypothetical protein
VNASLRLASVALLSLAPSAVRAQELEHEGALVDRGAAVQQTQRHWGENRLDLAMEWARAIDDPAQRHDWEFQILYKAGDLPGALAAALRGVEAAPDHLGLLQSATWCALTLGFAERAQALVEQWGKALERSEEPLQQIEASAQAREGMAAQVREIVGRDRRAAAAVARAKWTSIAILAVACVALAVLAFARPEKATGASR